MAKKDILNWYQNCIASAEKEVEDLRKKLDTQLDYLGQMNMKKYALINERKTYK